MTKVNMRSEEELFDDSDDVHSLPLNDAADGSSVQTDSAGESQRDEVNEVKKLTEKETRNVQVWRGWVLLLLFATGGALSYMTYSFLSSEEEDNHEDAFGFFATSIAALTEFRLQNLYTGLRGLGDTITAHAMTNGEEWPMVTVPNFEVEAEQVRGQTMTEFINVVPLVSLEDRAEYEQYTFDNQWWIEQSRQITLGKEGTLVETNDFVDMPISGDIISRCETGFCPAPNVTDRVYMPVWQVSPPPFVPFLVGSDTNGNGLSNRELEAIRTSKDLVLGSVFTTQFLTGTSISAEAHDSFHEKFITDEIGNSTANDRPHLIGRNPIFAILGDRSSEVVGIITSVIAMDAYMANLLPDGVSGVDLVLSNTCNQTWTYKLIGSKAAFIGEGDLHDDQYDASRRTIDFEAFLDPELSRATPGHCLYTIELYPTDEFVGRYTTYLPWLFTAVVGCTFLIMACVFFVYDYMGTRRNEKVVDTAARSNAIVSSLFPSKVRAKLMEEAKIKAEPHNTGQDRLKSFMNDQEMASSRHSEDLSGQLMIPGKPLAEMFDATTIMFADIAGFTRWSSDREPSEVFTLLETLYRVFDRAAKRRRIFKVETIGDCYVAVAGIPDPRKDHATSMAKFAIECQEHMRVLVHMLEEKLGPDTGELALRVGLHSGPCTAGVLRGDKSRFQLFGNTMNTASRMESTGEKDRIQISQETADELIVAGKADWIMPRQDKIVAKGKGELQTYWLLAKRSTPKSNDSSLDDCEDLSDELLGV